MTFASHEGVLGQNQPKHHKLSTCVFWQLGGKRRKCALPLKTTGPVQMRLSKFTTWHQQIVYMDDELCHKMCRGEESGEEERTTQKLGRKQDEQRCRK